MNFVGGTRLKETHGDTEGGYQEERFADAEKGPDGKKGPVKVKQTVIVELNPANMDAKPQKKQRPKSLYEQAKENERKKSCEQFLAKNLQRKQCYETQMCVTYWSSICVHSEYLDNSII